MKHTSIRQETGRIDRARLPTGGSTRSGKAAIFYLAVVGGSFTRTVFPFAKLLKLAG